MFSGLTQKIERLFLAGALVLVCAGSAKGDDFYKGMRGPTNWQLDFKVTDSINEKGTETLSNNLMLKYWDGDRHGKWGFISVPYKFVDSPAGSDSGLGDISVGFGPRGTIGNFHWMLYGSQTFPTGKRTTGTERHDTKITGLATYLTDGKKFEIDGAFEYNSTGKTNGRTTPDEFYAGLIFGGKIDDRVRVASGFTDLIKENGDYLLNWRVAGRYARSRETAYELVIDRSIGSRNIPKATSITAQYRRNF